MDIGSHHGRLGGPGGSERAESHVSDRRSTPDRTRAQGSYQGERACPVTPYHAESALCLSAHSGLTRSPMFDAITPHVPEPDTVNRKYGQEVVCKICGISLIAVFDFMQGRSGWEHVTDG